MCAVGQVEWNGFSQDNARDRGYLTLARQSFNSKDPKEY